METIEERFPFLFNKQADYNTNSKSYYDQLAKYNKVLQILAKMIEEYDEKLDNSLENINTVLTNYTTMLDGKLAGFDDSVMLLLREWIDDGTFEMIINTEIFNHKLDTATFTAYKENADSVALSHSEQLTDIFINAKEYGADPTGTTDSTSAINLAYTATPDGGTLFLPSGWYKILDTLTFNRPVNLQFDGNLEYAGERTKAAILVDGLSDISVKFNYVKDGSSDRTSLRGGWHGWLSDDYIGICLRNLKNCDIDIKRVANFTIGVRCLVEAGSGFWYNRVKINELLNNKIQLDLCSKDPNSWMNSNFWYDTAFNYYGTSNPEFITGIFNRVLINQSLLNGNEYGGNSNYFSNFKFETRDIYGGTFTTIKLVKGYGYTFENYRNELLGSNSDFCVLDLALTKVTDVKSCISDITFKPVAPGGNNAVTLQNADLGKNAYSDIYTFVPKQDKYLLVSEEELHKKYRFVAPNKHVVKNIFRKTLASTDLAETLFDYSAGDLSVLNGVNVQASHPLVFYITNLSIGDEITTNVEKSNSGVNQNIVYKAWDKTGVFCEGGLIGTTKVLSHNGFWDTVNKVEKTNISTNTDKITVNNPNLGTLAVLVYGGIKSIKIFTNNLKNVTKRTNITKLEKIDGFVCDSVPNKTTDGYFKPDDVVYYYNWGDETVTQYKLVYNEGVLTWISQGVV